MALLKMNDFEIECSLTYRTIPVKSKLNGQSFFTGDGRYHSISNHINRTLINLSLKDVQPKEWLRLKNFIEETICFQKVKVNVSVPHLDLGEGVGTTVLNCTYFKKTTEGIYKIKMPALYDINFGFLK